MQAWRRKEAPRRGIKKFEVHAGSQLSKLPTMGRTAPPQLCRPPLFYLWSGSAMVGWVCLLLLFVCGLAGCDRVGNSRYAQLMQDADNKSGRSEERRVG